MAIPILAGTKTKAARTGDKAHHTPSSAITAGTPTNLGQGCCGTPASAIAANALGSVDVTAFHVAETGGSATFSVGDFIYYSATTGYAAARALTSDPDDLTPLGVVTYPCVSGDVSVEYKPCGFDVHRNAGAVLQPFIYEFDCDGDNGDTDAHTLIPTWMNPNGLIYNECYAILTEQMAGSSEDQGIVTVEDSDGTDIATLTPSDAAADAVGDIIVGTTPRSGLSTGDVPKTVAAGKGVQAKVTQQTSGGTPAGKMKVYVSFTPLL